MSTSHRPAFRTSLWRFAVVLSIGAFLGPVGAPSLSLAQPESEDRSSSQNQPGDLADTIELLATDVRSRFDSLPRIALAPLVSSDPNLGCTPSGALYDDLLQALNDSFPDVAARDDQAWQAARIERERQQSVEFDPATAAQVGRTLGAKAVAVGVVSLRRGEDHRLSFRLQVRIVNVEHANYIATRTTIVSSAYFEACRLCGLTIANHYSSPVHGQVGAQHFEIQPASSASVRLPLGLHSLGFRVGGRDPEHIRFECNQSEMTQPLDPIPLSSRQRAGWITTGVGAAAALAVVAPAVVYAQNRSDYDSSRCAPSGTIGRDQMCPDERNAMDRSQRAMIGLSVTGGSALIAGLVMALLPSAEQRERHGNASLSCLPTAGNGAGVACVGRF